MVLLPERAGGGGFLIRHGGVTRDKILRPHRLFSQTGADSIAEFLNQHYAGWTLEAIRETCYAKTGYRTRAL